VSWEPRRGPATPEELAGAYERWPDAGRLHRAFMLACDVDVCDALLRGERVPLARLDPERVKRFGLREPTADGRVTLDDFWSIEEPAR
jgi:hypothetical protein